MRIFVLSRSCLGCFLVTSNVQLMTDLIDPETPLAMTAGRSDDVQAGLSGRSSVSGWTCRRGVGCRVSTGPTTGKGEGADSGLA